MVCPDFRCIFRNTPSPMESPSILETSSSPISEVTTVTDINGQSATHGQIQDKNDNNIRKSAKNCLNFMHLNIHHLFPKFDEIKHYLDNNNTIDILGLGETFLNEKFSDNEFKLHDYQFFRRDRSSNGGGIVLYVKNNCPCIVRDDLQTENTEGIWIEVKLHKQKPFIVGYLYRPPSSPQSWNVEIEKNIEKIYLEDKEVILFGDFNYNYINSETTNSLWNKILNTFNSQQLVLEPTRVTSNTSTITDHVYSNYPSQITNIQVPILSLSDH